MFAKKVSEKMEEIKNCPFCGSRPNVYHGELEKARSDYQDRYGTYWTIECEKCCIASLKSSWTRYAFDNNGSFRIDGDYDGRQDVISRWNERV